MNIVMFRIGCDPYNESLKKSCHLKIIYSIQHFPMFHFRMNRTKKVLFNCYKVLITTKVDLLGCFPAWTLYTSIVKKQHSNSCLWVALQCNSKMCKIALQKCVFEKKTNISFGVWVRLLLGMTKHFRFSGGGGVYTVHYRNGRRMSQH